MSREFLQRIERLEAAVLYLASVANQQALGTLAFNPDISTEIPERVQKILAPDLGEGAPNQ